MTWLDKLERRFGFLGIPGLTRILVGFTALVFALAWLAPGFVSMLDLDPARIRHGEVWRLFTYIFIPQTLSPWWILFALWFLWWIGDGLEQAWGAFRLTLYFLVGMIGTTAAAFFFGASFSNSMLFASLFYAFARFYPDQVIYVLFILPVKIKWLAWVLAALLFVRFFLGPMSYRVALVDMQLPGLDGQPGFSPIRRATTLCTPSAAMTTGAWNRRPSRVVSVT